jgi:hypothetical protein
MQGQLTLVVFVGVAYAIDDQALDLVGEHRRKGDAEDAAVREAPEPDAALAVCFCDADHVARHERGADELRRGRHPGGCQVAEHGCSRGIAGERIWRRV